MFSLSNAIRYRCGLALACAGLFWLPAYANVLSWSGGSGSSGNWNDSGNWGGVGVPANGDTVIFGAIATSRLASTNNLSGLLLNQIKFNGSSGGFGIYGNPFTLTNSIYATNTAGANTIYNNIALATSDVQMVVSNGASLTLAGVLSGSVGVNKTGLGTLTYNAPGNNTYTGTTLVSAGTLQFNVASVTAVSGPLVIGDGTGTGSPTVKDLQGLEMDGIGPVTINLNGTLDLNNMNEPLFFTANLTLSGGTIQTGAGTLTLSPNTTITVVAAPAASSISGNLNTGSGTLTLEGSGNSGLAMYANVSGSANIVQNGYILTTWVGANTYSGNYTANDNGAVQLANSLALGNTNNAMTLNGQTYVMLNGSINLTNRSLTLNGTGLGVGTIFVNSGPAAVFWQATNFTLGVTSQIDVYFTNASLNLIGPITGPGGLTKIGSGTLTLSGSTPNSYGGLTTVSAGELDLNKSSGIAVPSFGPGLVIGSGTTVRCLNNYQIWSIITPTTINSSGVLDLNGHIDEVAPLTMNGGSITTGAGQFYLNSTYGTVMVPTNSTISGNVYLDGDVVISNSAELDISAGISGSAGMTKTGPGSLYLYGANTYGGLTVVQQGYLWAENKLALGSTNSGTIVGNGASLVLGGSIFVTNEALTLNGPGPGGIGGYGSLDVESGNNGWFGPITNNADSTLDAWSSGSQLHINGTISGSGGLELFSGGGTISFEGSTANSYAGVTTVDAGCTLLLNKSPSVVQAVPGNLVVTGSSSVARLGNDFQLADADVLVTNGGLFDFATFVDFMNTLRGNGTVNFGVGSILVIGDKNGSSEFDGPMTGAGSTGGYTVQKQGSGTFTLGGNNTFTNGATYVSYGKLVVNGSEPLIPAIVDSGAMLGGTGTVGIITANGTVSPGTSPGILTCSNLTFTSSGNFTVELTGPSPGVDYDQLNVRGTNNLANAGLGINLAFTKPVALGQQFTIVNNDGTDPITGIFAGYPQGSSWLQNGFAVSISYNGGDGNDVVLTLTSIPGAVTGSTVTSGNGSHGIDPNGCNNLGLTITNTTGTPMTGINATLSTTTEGVLITQPYSPYPNIAANGQATNATPFQVSELPSFICGTAINLQLSVDSSLGSFTMNSVLQSGEPAGATNRFDNSVVTSIPDVGSIDSTNVVSGVVGPLTKVVVELYLTHTFDSDLTNISLIAPDGTTVLLSAANGGSGQNYGSSCASDATHTIFDDAAATAITSGTAPFVGTYRPQSPLSAFNGNGFPNGNWRLHIADGYGGSLGTLRCWSLFLYGTACASGSGACDLCTPAITNAITLGDPVQTGRWIGNLVVASCGSPKTWAGTSGGSLHYNVYTFTNTSFADACVTVVLQSPSNILATAYLNNFNPSLITSNYLGDAGDSTHGSATSFSFTVPAGAVFQVVVTEVNVNSGTQPYTLQLSGLPCPPPTLNIQSVATNQARLYWPTAAGGYLLEGQSNIVSGAWATVTNEPIVGNHQYNVTNAIMNPMNRFYRLHKP